CSYSALICAPGFSWSFVVFIELGIEISVPSSSVTMFPRTDLIVPSTFWPILSDFFSILGWVGSVFIWAVAPLIPIDAATSIAITTASSRTMETSLRVGRQASGQQGQCHREESEDEDSFDVSRRQLCAQRRVAVTRSCRDSRQVLWSAIRSFLHRRAAS